MSERSVDPQILWAKILSQVKLEMSAAPFDTWLSRSTALDLTNDLLTVTVPTAQAKETISYHLQRVIDGAAQRVCHRPLRTAFTVGDRTKGNGSHLAQSQGSQRSPAPAARSARDAGPRFARESETRFAVELVEFDPTDRGWVKTPNYAIRFWQPYLRRTPFSVWLVIRSFGYSGSRLAWTSIQTLADVCAGGNRCQIQGRAPHRGHKERTVGAIEVLERERVLCRKVHGEGCSTSYVFRVLDSLPLLTPAQVQTLSTGRQQAHDRFIRRAQLDLHAWNKLTLPTLAVRPSFDTD